MGMRRFLPEYAWYKKPRNLVIGGLAAVALFATGYLLNNKTVEEKIYQGQVVSFGEEGWVWTTYEGTLAMGGENRSVTGSFSLDRQARNGEDIEELARQLYHAQETRETVDLHVIRPASCWPWRSDSCYHVDKVTFRK